MFSLINRYGSSLSEASPGSSPLASDSGGSGASLRTSTPLAPGNRAITSCTRGSDSAARSRWVLCNSFCERSVGWPSSLDTITVQRRPVHCSSLRERTCIRVRDALRSIAALVSKSRLSPASSTSSGKLAIRSAARTLINDLSRKLEQWTGRRWTVIVSNDAGQPTLRSQNEVERNQRERAAESDPRVQEVLARFPGAKVVEVRKLAPEPPESDARGEDPAEGSG